MGKSIVTKCNDEGVYNQRKDYIMFYKEINKIKRSLNKRNINDVFKIKYKGHVFNCLPFLLNGSGYFSNTYRSLLTDSISRLSMITEPFFTTELYHVNGLDFNIMNSVIPSLMDMGIRMLGAYQYKYQPMELLRLLFIGSVEVFEAVILEGNTIHFNYNYKDICNTQAFCYYISIVWLLSLSPLLHTLCARDLRRFKFDSLLDSLIPEDSIHFKYICGELSIDELYNEYKKVRYEDGSSICIREIMSNSTEGKYNGEELGYLELGLCNEIYDTYTLNEDYKMNMHIAYCFLFDGTYEKLNNKIVTQTREKEREHDRADKSDEKLKKVREELNTLNKELVSKNKEIVDLKCKLSSIETNDKLKEEIDSLKDEVKKLKIENEHLFNERTSMKKLISFQKKQLKSISSSIVTTEDVIDDFEEDIDNNDSISIEDAVEKIKNFRITYVGCDNNSIDNKLSSYGLDNISKFSSNQRTIGKCDALVIFAIRCHHADVYKAEKLIKGKNIPIIYLNCVNVDQMIMSIYNIICNED